MSDTSNNFYNAVRGVMGLFGSTNKAKGIDGEDSTTSSLVPEFESTLSEENIIALTAKWTDDYSSYYQKLIKQQQKDNLDYWIGKQFNEMQTAGTRKPLIDNLIFEATETFLPIATRANPQAVVTANGTPEGDKLCKTVTNFLEYQAGETNLRMMLKGATRDWAIYLLGCLKIVWNSQKNDFEVIKILPSRLILDPNSFIGVNGIYHGEYIGEKKKITASRLVKMFPKKTKLIEANVQGAMGTSIVYTEWWTNTDVFFMLDCHVLGKYKNPHWNYSGTTKIIDPITKEETAEDVEGRNHFTHPQMPYLFISIFSLGKQPHDETSLITQNIPLQDVINRRYQQIDKNVDAQNNGVVLSGKHFTKEQAAEAATQLAKGNPLWVPDGNIQDSYVRDSAPQLPADVFNHLRDARDELRNIFGTSGSSPQGLEGQKTVRGKIMVNQMDTSRIGGGITEYIEKVAGSVYNWYVQMVFVYYTDAHSFSIVGPKAQELMSLRNTDINTKLHVDVKDGSLIPKDPLTKRNEAMDLWGAGAIAPIPLYTALDYPNPYESAKELLQWQLIQKGALPPQVMFPDLEMAPPVATGADPTNPVSGAEGQRTIETPQPDTIAEDSQQIISSVPLQ